MLLEIFENIPTENYELLGLEGEMAIDLSANEKLFPRKEYSHSSVLQYQQFSIGT